MTTKTPTAVDSGVLENLLTLAVPFALKKVDDLLKDRAKERRELADHGRREEAKETVEPVSEPAKEPNSRAEALRESIRAAAAENFATYVNMSTLELMKWRGDKRPRALWTRATPQEKALWFKRIDRLIWFRQNRYKGGQDWTLKDVAWSRKIVRAIAKITDSQKPMTYNRWLWLRSYGHDWERYHHRRLGWKIRTERAIRMLTGAAFPTALLPQLSEVEGGYKTVDPLSAWELEALDDLLAALQRKDMGSLSAPQRVEVDDDGRMFVSATPGGEKGADAFAMLLRLFAHGRRIARSIKAPVTPEGSVVGYSAGDAWVEWGQGGVRVDAPQLALTWRRARPKELILDRVVVASADRGKGVGRAVINAVRSLARRVGASKIAFEPDNLGFWSHYLGKQLTERDRVKVLRMAASTAPVPSRPSMAQAREMRAAYQRRPPASQDVPEEHPSLTRLKRDTIRLKNLDNATVEQLRREYASIRRISHAETPAEFDAAVKAHMARHGFEATPKNFVIAARAVRFKCEDCGGTGQYRVWSKTQGRQIGTEPHWRCAGTGWQNDADRIRNIWYDLKRPMRID